jgi:hypothetical protein
MKIYTHLNVSESIPKKNSNKYLNNRGLALGSLIKLKKFKIRTLKTSSILYMKKIKWEQMKTESFTEEAGIESIHESLSMFRVNYMPDDTCSFWKQDTINAFYDSAIPLDSETKPLKSPLGKLDFLAPRIAKLEEKSAPEIYHYDFKKKIK